MNDSVPSSPVEEKTEKDEERHFSIAHGIQDADLSEIASAVSDLADILPLYVVFERSCSSFRHNRVCYCI